MPACVVILQRRAYLISALVIGALYFLCCLVLFLGVKEQLGKNGSFLKYSFLCNNKTYFAVSDLTHLKKKSSKIANLYNHPLTVNIINKL